MKRDYRVRCVDGVVSTDDIIPGRYKHMYSDPAQLAPHVFESRLPGFAASVAVGDAIWCDDTFGIGSSREQAATSLLAAGLRAVIAPRFGRIFFRNAWNVGLWLITAPRPPSAHEGGRIAVDWDEGLIEGAFDPVSFAPPPGRIREMVEAGGLLAWVRRRVQPGAGTGRAP